MTADIILDFNVLIRIEVNRFKQTLHLSEMFVQDHVRYMDVGSNLKPYL